MSQVCPYCKLANPPDALQCDCGYDFVFHKFPPAVTCTTKSARSRLVERWLLITLLIIGLPIVGYLAIVIFVYVECYVFHNCF